MTQLVCAVGHLCSGTPWAPPACHHQAVAAGAVHPRTSVHQVTLEEPDQGGGCDYPDGRLVLTPAWPPLLHAW